MGAEKRFSLHLDNSAKIYPAIRTKNGAACSVFP